LDLEARLRPFRGATRLLAHHIIRREYAVIYRASFLYQTIALDL